MKWGDSTRRISYRVTAYGPAYDGGHDNGVWNDCLKDFPETFKVIRNHNAATARSFGRATRRRPKTIPWAVALPLLVWLWWRGEL
jgi:hypothetical protein